MSANAPARGLSGDQQRSLLNGLLDDASVFPPGSLPMHAAVAAHTRNESAWFSELTGPFVCSETRLTELGRVLTTAGLAWIDLSLVVTAGAAAVSAAIDAVAADPRLRLRAIEVPADSQGDPVQTAIAVATALDAVPLAAAAGYIEVPLPMLADDGTAGELLAVADSHGYRVKLRTGGATPDTFPDEAVLAACLVTLAARRVPFKCTAGLHHAVRNTAADTSLEQHGFLNILLAAGAAVGGAAPDEIAAILAQRDAASIAAAISAVDPATADEIRWLFTSFGTCSTDEPVADLVSLGLLSKP